MRKPGRARGGVPLGPGLCQSESGPKPPSGTPQLTQTDKPKQLSQFARPLINLANQAKKQTLGMSGASDRSHEPIGASLAICAPGRFGCEIKADAQVARVCLCWAPPFRPDKLVLAPAQKMLHNAAAPCRTPHPNRICSMRRGPRFFGPQRPAGVQLREGALDNRLKYKLEKCGRQRDSQAYCLSPPSWASKYACHFL